MKRCTDITVHLFLRFFLELSNIFSIFASEIAVYKDMTHTEKITIKNPSRKLEDYLAVSG